MPDQTSRKRLKKKVLDRWENEGGMIPEKPKGSLEGDQVKELPANDRVPRRPAGSRKRR